ncbi:MAG: hypothetical protein ACFB4I_17530 [Cyanophyceae cyanobacterium]
MSLYQVEADYSYSNNWTLIRESYHQEQIPIFPPKSPRISGFWISGTHTQIVWAAQIETEKYKDSWHTGGWLSQRIDVPGVFNSGRTAKVQIPLNEVYLFTLPSVNQEYRLYFAPAPWLIDMTFRLWKFTGEVKGNDLVT